MKSKKIISTTLAPLAIGAYSQAVKSNGFLFTSGQIPIDVATGELVSENIDEQIHQVLKNIKGLLESEKLSIDNICG